MEDWDFLKSVMFVEFDPDELQAIRNTMILSRFAPDDMILSEGNANRALHVIKAGRIRVSRHGRNKDATSSQFEILRSHPPDRSRSG